MKDANLKSLRQCRIQGVAALLVADQDNTMEFSHITINEHLVTRPSLDSKCVQLIISCI